MKKYGKERNLIYLVALYERHYQDIWPKNGYDKNQAKNILNALKKLITSKRLNKKIDLMITQVEIYDNPVDLFNNLI